MRDSAHSFTCGAVRELVLQDLHRDLPPAEESRLRSHLSDCAACAREVERISQIGQVLRRDPLPVSEVRLPSGEALVRSVVEAAHGGERNPRLVLPWAGWAVGAIAGLAVAVVALRIPSPPANPAAIPTPIAAGSASPGFWIEDDEQSGRTVLMEARPVRPVTQ